MFQQFRSNWMFFWRNKQVSTWILFLPDNECFINLQSTKWVLKKERSLSICELNREVFVNVKFSLHDGKLFCSLLSNLMIEKFSNVNDSSADYWTTSCLADQLQHTKTAQFLTRSCPLWSIFKFTKPYSAHFARPPTC